MAAYLRIREVLQCDVELRGWRPDAETPNDGWSGLGRLVPPVRWGGWQGRYVAFDHERLNIFALEPGEHGFESLPDRVGDRFCEDGQQNSIHGEDSLVRIDRPSVTEHGVVNAAVTAQREDGRAEQVAGDLLAFAVEEAVGMPENEVEFAGVVVGERQRASGRRGGTVCRSADPKETRRRGRSSRPARGGGSAPRLVG
ncbi:hypothetical protein [Streptomyces typhae]|uniref:hypothetical protein n=1 Tax=Streptomyces typhae TaxID=2681492 RepID=UPI0012F6B623|nr:hypothetical protein [Streptomyces typhae]